MPAAVIIVAAGNAAEAIAITARPIAILLFILLSCCFVVTYCNLPRPVVPRRGCFLAKLLRQLHFDLIMIHFSIRCRVCPAALRIRYAGGQIGEALH